MNKLTKLLVLFTVLIFSACSSDDEPEPEYTGPWEVVYDEQYIGWHTKDPNFKNWFLKHLQDFEDAEFKDASGSSGVTYTKDNGDWIEWQDYSKWYSGRIIWAEKVQYASENEIKAKVNEFESFSSYKSEIDHQVGDDFRAHYRRLGQ